MSNNKTLHKLFQPGTKTVHYRDVRAMMEGLGFRRRSNTGHIVWEHPDTPNTLVMGTNAGMLCRGATNDVRKYLEDNGFKPKEIQIMGYTPLEKFIETEVEKAKRHKAELDSVQIGDKPMSITAQLIVKEINDFKLEMLDGFKLLLDAMLEIPREDIKESKQKRASFPDIGRKIRIETDEEKKARIGKAIGKLVEWGLYSPGKITAIGNTKNVHKGKWTPQGISLLKRFVEKGITAHRIYKRLDIDSLEFTSISTALTRIKKVIHTPEDNTHSPTLYIPSTLELHPGVFEMFPEIQ